MTHDTVIKTLESQQVTIRQDTVYVVDGITAQCLHGDKLESRGKPRSYMTIFLQEYRGIQILYDAGINVFFFNEDKSGFELKVKRMLQINDDILPAIFSFSIH